MQTWIGDVSGKDFCGGHVCAEMGNEQELGVASSGREMCAGGCWGDTVETTVRQVLRWEQGWCLPQPRGARAAE